MRRLVGKISFRNMFFVGFCSFLFFANAKNERKKEIENQVPVFKMNFYLMGRDSVDEKITVAIGENIDYMNQEFEGQVKFKLNKLVMDVNHEYLPILYDDYREGDKNTIDDLVKPVEHQGGVNIFLFDTFRSEDTQNALMGFTPILSAYRHAYEINSPRFDRIYMAYPGLQSKSTLVHEMGHFLGLRHPWDMNRIDRELMGLLKSDSLDYNHMTYSIQVSQFTEEQLFTMKDFSLRFRNYLLDTIQMEP